MQIYKEITFEAAHNLPNVPEEHKCRRLHGHSYRLRITVEGLIGEESGWVRDFSDLTSALNSVKDRLDHYYLNEIDGLSNPTSENLAKWVFNLLFPTLPDLAVVEVSETCTSGVIYRGR